MCLTVLCWPTVLCVFGHKSKTHIAQLCPWNVALDQNEKVVTYSNTHICSNIKDMSY